MSCREVAIVRGLYISERRSYENICLEARAAGEQVEFSNYLPSKHWDGNRKRKSIWPKITKGLQDHNLDPLGYIPYIFNDYRFIHRPPEPNELLSHTYIDSYLKQKKHEQRDTFLILKSYWDKMGSEMWCNRDMCEMDGSEFDERATRRHLLLSEEVTSSDLFRFCFGLYFRFDDVVEQCMLGAAREYAAAKRANDAVWTKEFLSPTTRTFLLKTYRAYLEKLGRQRRWN